MVQHSILILAIHIGGYVICVSEKHNQEELHDCSTKGHLIKLSIFMLTFSYLFRRNVLSSFFFSDSIEGINLFLVHSERFPHDKGSLSFLRSPLDDDIVPVQRDRQPRC